MKSLTLDESDVAVSSKTPRIGTMHQAEYLNLNCFRKLNHVYCPLPPCLNQKQAKMFYKKMDFCTVRLYYPYLNYIYIYVSYYMYKACLFWFKIRLATEPIEFSIYATLHIGLKMVLNYYLLRNKIL